MRALSLRTVRGSGRRPSCDEDFNSSHPLAVSTHARTAHRKNTARTPKNCASRPDSTSPSSCAKNTTDITVLEIRPISACGVSRCISVCAGTMMAANVKPRVNVPSSATDTQGTAPRSSAPTPTPARPASTSVLCDTCIANRRTAGVPASMPAPTMALTTPNTAELPCSHSRTYTAISGPKQPIVNRPAAIASTTNDSAG